MRLGQSIEMTANLTYLVLPRRAAPENSRYLTAMYLRARPRGIALPTSTWKLWKQRPRIAAAWDSSN
eukprot:CAMPEP_0177566994 /NCGR_PEP_ID=MMETSP0369-20130122/74992_1 /TAXON_ID=447022 ORGANISM="Scrippsiella hangoei-like, Strain SHHI-4" /NCGR_SAMPLE_ID=MMETSP0369 /ASSEMBLY_ACC=CAM_ASM_000364 /LENGTH=66 /DNA_ID=CAMNT_0019054479 /DNA_START=283 /DNA_END=480 /DNA_ORIENTATION=+